MGSRELKNDRVHNNSSLDSEYFSYFLFTSFRIKRAPQFQFPGVDNDLVGNVISSITGGIIPTTTTTTPSPSIGGFGEAIGEAAFQFTNNIINPCRGGRFGPIQEAGQGFLAGFIGSGISNSIFGNPCG